jgi:hypothetical protein
MIQHRDRGGNRGRMGVRHIDGTGTELDLSVAAASQAMNAMQEVMFSALSVTCSPT